MKRMGLFGMITVLQLFAHVLYAQIDSIKNVNDSNVLKKGFYKTYREFLDNSPSILLNFSTQLFTAGKDNPTTVRAEYTIIDTTDMFGDFWGFCDGEDIFVSYGGFFELKYWKLQCKGPNPFFYYKRSPPSAVTAIGLPAHYELMFIDNNGKSRNDRDYDLKRLLKDNKLLLKEYKNEIRHTTDIMVAYIKRYNESKLKM